MARLAEKYESEIRVKLKEKFKDTKFKVIETGIKHGTVTLVYDNLKLELTTLRKDVETYGRHAEVEYTDDWQLDSERRDFTINAIYSDSLGNLFDPQNGKLDLEKGILKRFISINIIAKRAHGKKSNIPQPNLISGAWNHI